jgi:N,N'-diacetyllegionaminate synthase
MKNRTYIIAEIAQGFEGDPFLCKKFIDLAKKCGADAVKFQIFKTEEICTHSYKDYDIFKSLEFDELKWSGLIEYADSIGIDFWSDIFGVETYRWISRHNIKGIKLHSTDVKNEILLNELKNFQSSILISTGGSELSEIGDALKLLGDCNVSLITGFQAEPNQLVDIELDKINFLKCEFQKDVGYADHFDAKDKLSILIPVIAVIRGATIIEKHLTLDRENLQLEDYISALNPDEFSTMVRYIRDVEQFTSTGNEYKLGARETHYRSWTKKCIVARKNLKKGDVIGYENVVLLRTGESNPEFFDYKEVIGKIVLNPVNELHVLRKSDLE